MSFIENSDTEVFKYIKLEQQRQEYEAPTIHRASSITFHRH